jgi:hypothetical protein
LRWHLEQTELRNNDKSEHQELAAIYVGRGLETLPNHAVAAPIGLHFLRRSSPRQPISPRLQ